jgi:hypothetical protein
MDLTLVNELNILAEGEQYHPDDYAVVAPSGAGSMASYVDNSIGRLLSVLGITNGLPVVNPAQAIATGGMGVSLGGNNQVVFAQGRELDSCPVTPFVIAAADPANPRIDLVAVQASRVQGTQQILRTVRPDNAPAVRVTLGGVLAAGTSGVINLPAGYTIGNLPKIVGLTPIGAGGNTLNVRAGYPTATQVIIDSTNGADVRAFVFDVVGTPTGYAGTPTEKTLYENQPEWEIIPGVPAAVPVAPATPAGWEAFAQILVPAGAAAIAQGNITTLFQTITRLGSNGVLAPNGQVFLPGGARLLWGSQAAVSANATTYIPYWTAFNVQSFQPAVALDTGVADSGDILSCKIHGLTAAGFSITVGGGSPGNLVTVRYQAIGV